MKNDSVGGGAHDAPFALPVVAPSVVEGPPDDFRTRLSREIPRLRIFNAPLGMTRFFGRPNRPPLRKTKSPRRGGVSPLPVVALRVIDRCFSQKSVGISGILKFSLAKIFFRAKMKNRTGLSLLNTEHCKFGGRENEKTV